MSLLPRAGRRRAPFPYDVVAVTIEQGKFETPIGAVEAEVRRLGVDWVRCDDRTTLRLVAIATALGNVNPYTLFDAALSRAGADPAPAVADDVTAARPPTRRLPAV